MERTQTRKISVGSVDIGGDAPVSVQSMCCTKTSDVSATLAQIEALEGAGCDIVRLAVPDINAAKALYEIRRNTKIPLVADIHFDYKLALAAADAGIDKIRINPGNIGGSDKVRAVADACRDRHIPIRVGVNTGSIEKPILEKYGRSSRALCESALSHVRLLEEADFFDICVSIKSSDVSETVLAYRMLSEMVDYPLHMGVTETGIPYHGIIKSAVGIGTLLMEGIGSTIRVSLTDDPVEEVRAGISILKAAGLRREGIELISCPTCGRTEIDLFSAVTDVEERLRNVKRPLTVAVMGCVVNGPGEASHADYGLAGGRGEALLFRKGQPVEKVPEARMVEALCELIAREENIDL